MSSGHHHDHSHDHAHGHGHSHAPASFGRAFAVGITLNLAFVIVEAVYGVISGSMALVADGWHMSTHAAALGIAAFAYRFARQHAHDRRFSFGTGKLGDLAAFASALLLMLVAIAVGWESAMRLMEPVPIVFGQAMAVAVIGLAVNLLSAWLLDESLSLTQLAGCGLVIAGVVMMSRRPRPVSAATAAGEGG